MFDFDVEIMLSHGGETSAAKTARELDFRRMHGRFVRMQSACVGANTSGQASEDA